MKIITMLTGEGVSFRFDASDKVKKPTIAKDCIEIEEAISPEEAMRFIKQFEIHMLEEQKRRKAYIEKLRKKYTEGVKENGTDC